MKLILVGIAAVALILLPAIAFARARFIEGGPQHLSDTRSLGDIIREAQRPVHIGFVHGMRAEGAGNSDVFRAALSRLLSERGRVTQQSTRHFLDLGSRPAGATYAGVEIWHDDEEWMGSRPFIDRHELSVQGGPTVIVDEVNWWPLLFPLKCRFLVAPEHDLSGNDAAHLRLCARRDSPYFSWLSEAEVDAMLAARPRSRGGARFNAWGKQQIMNWGLADAVILLGPMRTYFIDAIDQALAFADAGAARAQAEEQVLISESLGSFLVMDAFRERRGGARAYLERTRNLYFFANQFALLELGRIELPPQARTESLGVESATPSPLASLAEWGAGSDQPERIAEARPPAQIIAFSDPSDLLTYRVPPIPNVAVVNVYVRNAPAILGLAAHPVRAHTGHARNRTVLDLVLRPSAN